jgi:hypothetical protein
MSTSAKDLKLWKNDPLLGLLKEKLGFSNLRITVYLTGIIAILHLGLGWIADNSYEGGGIRFTEPQFIVFALVYVFVIIPCSIWLYVWQMDALTSILADFGNRDVIRERTENGSKNVSSYADFLAGLQTRMDRRRWTVIALISVIAILLVMRLTAWPSEIRSSGRSVFFYDVKWFLVVLLLEVAIPLYALCMFALKTVLSVWILNCLFRWFEVRIRPMHPDNAGGLGALGNYALRLGMIAVGFGVFASVYTLQVRFVGDNPGSRPDVLLFWAIYVLITPTALILPMLSAHRAMRKARDAQLMGISREFERILSDASPSEKQDTESIKKTNKRLSGLQDRYRIVMESFPTWPISIRLLRRFSMTTLLPVVSGVISLVTSIPWPQP